MCICWRLFLPCHHIKKGIAQFYFVAISWLDCSMYCCFLKNEKKKKKKKRAPDLFVWGVNGGRPGSFQTKCGPLTKTLSTSPTSLPPPISHGNHGGGVAAGDRDRALRPAAATEEEKQPLRGGIARQMPRRRRECWGGGAEPEGRPRWDAPWGGRAGRRGALEDRRVDLREARGRRRQPRAYPGEHPRRPRRRQWPSRLQGDTISPKPHLLPVKLSSFY